MEFFVDTASVDEVEQVSAMGFRGGVTTNPSLMKKAVAGEEEEHDLHALLRRICDLVDGPVSAEVISESAEDMIKEAEVLTALDSKIIIKCPMSTEGLKACHALSSKGVRTNMTLVFSVGQAVLAAEAGATYVSFFVGRLDDIGVDGMALVEQVLVTFRDLGFTAKVLVASVRHPLHVYKALHLGVPAITIPFKVIVQLTVHDLTSSGIKKFLEDGEKAGMTR